MTWIAGIDYSMTCPCIGMASVENFSFHTTSFFYLTDKPKFAKVVDNLNGRLFPKWKNEQERYANAAQWVVDIVHGMFACDTVFIEGYSMGSKGKVFHIAENTAIAKDRLWTNGASITSVPPTVIKKFATGKGNSPKHDMEAAFLAETGYDVRAKLGMTAKQDNPSSDIIDSYYILKYGIENYANAL